MTDYSKNHSPLLPPFRWRREQGRRREQQHTESGVDLSRGYFALQYGFVKTEGCQPLLAA